MFLLSCQKITLEFYQKKKSRWMFKPEEIPWEIWTIKIEQMQLLSENGIHIYQDEKKKGFSSFTQTSISIYMTGSDTKIL